MFCATIFAICYYIYIYIYIYINTRLSVGLIKTLMQFYVLETYEQDGVAYII